MNLTVEDASAEERRLMVRITEYLQTMRWPMRLTRKNIGTDPNRRAFVLGRVRKLDVPFECVESRFNKKFADLFEMLKRLVRLHNPTFRYNAIQLNANVQTEPHYDRNNEGLSYCLALGSFTGGGLMVYPEDSQPRRYANRHKWVLYDGKHIKHGSAPVTAGVRFALIYYKCVPRSRRSRSRRASRRRSGQG